MAAVGNDGQRLATILAEMIRSALAWEKENGPPRSTDDHESRNGVDGVPRAYTLSDHNGATRPHEAEEGGES